ncbi:MAG: formyltransferase family protein [Thermomicrobiales bacterium]
MTDQTNVTSVFLGHSCASSLAALAALRAHGLLPAALILAAADDCILPPGFVIDDAEIVLARSPGQASQALARLSPEVAVAACFPWRLSPAAVLAPRLGVLNIHPSLLPHGRGPEPVFWAFRDGVSETGVTVHRMDATLDTGPILAQQRALIPNNADAVSLECDLMTRGVELIATAWPALLAGSAQLTPQPPGGGYQPAPGAADWLISPLLPAAWAWRFSRAVAPLSGPLAVLQRGEVIPVRQPLAWAPDGPPPGEVPPGTVLLQCRPGWVLFSRN